MSGGECAGLSLMGRTPSLCVQVEMVFAKADPRVSLLYEEYLVAKELVPFGDNLRR